MSDRSVAAGSATTHPALAGVRRVPLWLDDASAPEPAPALTMPAVTDLCVVGGGYTGLWTAIRAKERDPDRDVVLLERDRCGGAASGRNGGFVEASLTHGLANACRHFPREVDTLERLGQQNLDGLCATVDRYSIDCDLERVPVIDVVTSPHHLEDLERAAARVRTFGGHADVLDGTALRDRVHSPAYLGGLERRDAAVLVNPARLAWGLRRAAESLGVRIHEYTPVSAIRSAGKHMEVATPGGSVRAARVAIGTNAWTGLLRRMRWYITPVYDYCLATAPLTPDQWAAVGWTGREGLSDSGNQFHYYRRTADDRIIWGGYDAVHHFGGRIRPRYDERPETWDRLARHFFETFPRLDGLAFTHAWGGVIDTSTRLCAFWDTAHDARVAYAAGFTGLGVGTTRFAADVLLDLLDGSDTERTRLDFVRKVPWPWPPEPFRSLGIEITRRSLAQEDRTGKRNLWLQVLDALGVGFDS